MSYKRSQAAMEFLMTYGWAILVVMAAIAALAYFGVLRPQGFLPEKCILEPGVACLDFKVAPSEALFMISNSLGKDIDVIEITAGQCSQSFNQTLNNGDRAQFTLSGCDNGAVGATFKEDITIEYVSRDFGFAKTIKGTVSTKIQ